MTANNARALALQKTDIELILNKIKDNAELYCIEWPNLSKAQIIKLEHSGFTVEEMYNDGREYKKQDGLIYKEKIFNGKYNISWHPKND